MESANSSFTGTLDAVVPVADANQVVQTDFELKKKNHVIIHIYGVNDQALGGDALKIKIEGPIDDATPVPSDALPLHRSNYKELEAFINTKLNDNFKNTFKKDLSQGTKSDYSLNRTSTLGNAKADIIQRLNNGSITDPLLEDAIKAFVTQLQNLDHTKYPDTDTSDWRNILCTANYEIKDASGAVIDNWNKKDIGAVYDLIRGKNKSQSTPIDITNTNTKNNVAGLLGKLRDMIEPDDSVPKRKEQIDAINSIINTVNGNIDGDILKYLNDNLTYMFGAVDDKTNTPRIVANKYRHLYWDDANKLFYAKSFNLSGTATKSTSPLSGDELTKKLTTKIFIQRGGNKTRKQNSKNKKQRKTNKK